MSKKKFAKKWSQNKNPLWSAVLALMTAQTVPINVMAQDASPGSASGNSTPSGSTNSSGSSSNLDLSSTQSSIASEHSGTIFVGGTPTSSGVVSGGQLLNINVGQLLTPAQYAALGQVISGYGQHIVVDTQGAAIAGSVNIASGGQTPVQAMSVASISSLVVPTNVQLNTIGFSSSNPLSISGSANILGSVFNLQTSSGLTSVLNFGNNLNIASGGLLSSYLPSNMTNIAGLFSSQNMTLNIAGNLTNSGTITTPGNLNLNVMGAINNASIGAAQAAMLAGQNINILSGSGNLFNTGVLRALDSINISNMTNTTDLLLNSIGGTVEALNAINLRDVSYVDKAETIVTGGSWLSNEFNANAGEGLLDINVLDLTGTLNLHAGEAHFFAQGDKGVELGNIIVTGDPTFWSNAAISIGAGLTFAGQALTIVSSNNITFTNNLTLSTAAAGGGGEINIIAGVNFTSSGGPQFPTQATQNITFNGLGAGGTVSDGGKTITIDSRGTAGNANGGTVRIIAYQQNGGTNEGQVQIANTTITAGGSGTGSNGNVWIIQGDTNAATLNLPTITSTGGSGGGGNLTIAAATPNTGSFTANTAGVLNADITPGASTSRPIQTNGIINVAGDIVIQGGSTLTLDDNLTGKTISITTTSNGNVAVNSDITGVNGVSITTNGTGGVTVSNNDSINSTNAAINILANDITFTNATTSTISAGTGTVTLAPNGNQTIGINGGAGTFGIETRILDSTTAGTLVIGNAGAGNVTHQAGYDFNNGGFTSTLSVVTGGTYSLTTAATTNVRSKTFTVTSTGLATINQPFSGNNSGTVNISGGGVSQTANIALTLGGTSSITLTSTGAANDITRTGATNLQADSITFNSGRDVGAAATPMLTTTGGTIKVNAAGSGFVTNTGAFTLGASSVGNAVGNKLVINGNNTITIGGTITGRDITVNTTANSGNIAIGNNDIGDSNTQNISLNPNSGGSITSGTGVLTALAGTPTISLTVAGAGTIGATGAATDINTATTGTLTLSSGTSAFVTNTGAFTLAASSVAAAGVMDVRSNDTMTLSGALTGGDIQLRTTANSGNIVLGANNVGTAATSNILLNSNGSITSSTSVLTTGAGAKSISLTAVGDIGATGAASDINTATTGTLTLSGTNAFVTNTGAFTLNASSVGTAAGNTMDVRGDNTLTLGGALTGRDIQLRTTANAGNIVLGNNNVGTAATESILLNANGSVTSGTSLLTAQTGTPTIALTAATNVGTGASGGATDINTSTNGTVTINTTTGTGSLNNVGGFTLGASSTGTTLDVRTVGPGTGNMSTTGNISGTVVTLTTFDGDIITGGNITASNGALTFNATTGTNGLKSNAASVLTSTGAANDVVFNLGSGGISTSGNNLTVVAGRTVNYSSTGNITSTPTADGSGGNLSFTANNGNLSFAGRDIISSGQGATVLAAAGSITLNASAIAGGTITAKNITANGTGSAGTASNGGNISLSAGTAGGITLTGGVSSNGGAGTDGAGGSISLLSGGNIIAGGSVSAQGQGTGNGGSVTIGNANTALVQVTGSIASDALGSANAGNVAITYGSGSSQFLVGAAGANSFVSGNITSTAGAGTAGAVSLARSNGDLALTVSSKIDAKNGTSALNTITLNPQNNTKNVTVNGTGSLFGIITSAAVNNFTVSMTNAGSSDLDFGNVSATGAVSISNGAGGGNITLANASTVSGSSITVTNNGSGNILSASSSGKYSTTGALSLNATNGNIGAGTGSRLFTQGSGNFSAQATGTVSVNNTGALTLTGTNSAGGDYDLLNSTTINVASAVSSTNGDVNLSANAGASAINTSGNNLTVDAGKSISLTASSINTTNAALSAGKVTLTASKNTGTGNITAGPITASATGAAANGGDVLLTVQNAGTGSIAVGNIDTTSSAGKAGNVNINIQNAGTGTISTGSINTNSGGTSAGNISIDSNSGTGGLVTIGGNLSTRGTGAATTAGSVSIINNGDGANNGGIKINGSSIDTRPTGAAVAAGSVTISATNSGGGNIDLNGLATITTNAGTGAGVTIQGASFTAPTANLNIIAAGNNTILLKTTNNTAAGDIILGTGAGAIQANVAAGTFTVDSGHSILDPGNTLASTANKVNLTANTGASGDIGASAQRVFLATSNLTLSGTNAFVTNTGAFTLNASSVGTAAGNTMDVRGDNTLTLGGALTGRDIQLRTTANAGNIVLGNNNVGTAATESILLNANGSVTSGTSLLTAQTGTPTISLTAATNVGTGASGGASDINTSTNGTITINATTGSGSLNNVGGFTLGASAVGTTLDVSTIGPGAGDMTTTGAISGTAVTLTTFDGDISLGGNVTASNGALTFNASTGSGTHGIKSGAAGVLTSTGAANDVVFNLGSGGISTNGNNLTVVAGRTVNYSSTGNITSTPTADGSGGNLSFTANNGSLNFAGRDIVSSGQGATVLAAAGSITLNASAIAGGTITAQNITANGTGSAGTASNGGNISLSAGTAGGITLTGGVSSNGGAGTNGAGGSISLLSGGNIVAGGSVSAQGQGSGNGGSVTIGNGNTALVQVTGSITSDALGSGNAGSIAVTYGSGSSQFLVGAAGANSFVSGNITGAAGAGTAGAVSLARNNGDLDLTVSSKIDAKNGTSALNTITFNPQNNTKNVTVNGTGDLFGIISSTAANNFTVNMTNAASSDLDFGNVSATGAVSISNGAGGGNITLANASTVSGSSITVTNNGSGNILSASSSGKYSTTGALSLNATNGNIGAGTGSRLFTQGSGNFSAQATGTVSVNNTGALTLTGTNSADGNYDLLNSTTINVASAVSSTNGDVNLSANAGASAINTSGNDLTIDAGKSISLTSSSINTTNAALSAGKVTLTASKNTGTGNITAGPITASATGAAANGGDILLTVQNAGTGSITVGNIDTTSSLGKAGNVNINIQNAGTGTISTGSINTNSGGTSAGNISIDSNSGTGGLVTIGGNLSTRGTGAATTAGSVSIINNGDGANNGGIKINGSSIDTRPIGAAVAAGSVTISATNSGGGNVNLNGLTTIITNGGTGAGVTIQGTSFTAPTANLNISAAGNNTILLKTTNNTATGDIILGTGAGAIQANAASGTFNVDSGHSILDPGNTLAATANTINLTANTGASGDIGSSASQRVVVATSNLNTVTGSNAWIQVNNAVTVSTANVTVPNTVDILATGTLTVGAAGLSAQTINLTTTGATSDIDGTGTLTATTALNLNSGRNIGSSGTPLATTTPSMTIVAANDAYVSQSGSANTNLGNSSAGNKFELTSANKLTLTGTGASAISAVTGLKLNVTSGNLVINSAPTNTLVVSGNGDVDVTVAAGNIVTFGNNPFNISSGQDINLSVSGKINSTIGTGGVSLTAVRNINASGVNIDTTNSTNAAAANITLASTGGAGTITIGNLTADGGAATNAGQISITQNSSALLDVTSFTMSASATGTGNAGTLIIANGGDSVSSNNGGIKFAGTATVTAASGSGGVINIDARGVSGAKDGIVDLSGASSIDVSATGGAGNGGNLSLRGLSFTMPGASAVALAANSSGGSLGNITVQSTSTTADVALGNAAGQFDLGLGSTSNWDITSGHDLNVQTAQSTSGRIVLSAGGSTGGNININANLTSTSSLGMPTPAIDLTAYNNIEGTGVLKANTAVTSLARLTTTTGSIGSSGALKTQVRRLRVSAFDSANIAQTGTLTIEQSSVGNAAGNKFIVSGVGAIGLAGNITGNSISITSTNSSIGIGAFNIGDTVNTTSVSLNAATNITSGVGILSTTAAGTVSLTAGTNVGASGAVTDINTQTGNLTVSAGGSAFVSNTGAVNLNTSSVDNATGQFDLSSSGTVTMAGALTGNNLKITTSGGNIAIGAFNIGDTTNTGTVTLNANQAITGSTGVVSTTGAGTVSLTAGTNIGASGAATDINTQTGNLTVSATNGNAFVGNTGVVNLNASAVNNATGQFVLNSTDTVTMAGALTGNNLSIITSAGDIAIGSIDIGDTTNTGLVTLNANQAITASTGVLKTTGAGTVSLTAGTNIGASGAATDINTQTGNLTVSSAGSAFVSNTGAVNLNASAVNNATGQFVLNASGTVTMAGALTGNNLSITTSAGNIAIGAFNIGTTANTSLVTLNANQAITASTGTLRTTGAGAVSLTAGTNIGASGAATDINTQTGNLTVSATNGNAFVGNTGAVNLNASAVNSASGQFVLNSTGTVTMAGALTGNDLSIITSGGNIAIGAFNIGDTTNTGLVTLNANQAITASTGTLRTTGAGTVSLTAGTNIGASGAATDINTQTSNLTVSATSGNAFVGNTGAVNLNASAVSNASGQFVLNSTGAVSLAGNLAGNNLSIITSAGNIVLGTFNIGQAGSTAAVTLNSASAITNSTGTIFANAGTISLTAVGSVGTGATGGASDIQTNTTGTINVVSSGAGVALTNTGAFTLGNSSASNAVGNLLNIRSNNTMTVSGTVTGRSIQLVTNGAGDIAFGASSIGDASTANIVFISSNNITGTSTLTAGVPGSTITLTSGGSIGATGARISTSSTNLNFNANNEAHVNIVGSTTFTGGIGGANSTVDVRLNGGTLTTNAGSNIVSTAGDMTFTLDGGAILTANGDISTGKVNGVITINGNGNITVGGTGQIAIGSGGASNKIDIVASSGSVTLSSNKTYDPGTNAAAQVNITASTIIQNNANQTMSRGVITFNAPTLSLANGSNITLSNASSPLTITAPGNLAVTVADGGTATITSGGGAFNVQSGGAGTLTFGAAGLTLPTTLNLDGAPLSLTSTGGIVVNSKQTVSTNNTMTVNSNTATAMNLAGTLSSASTLTVRNNVGGNLAIAFNGGTLRTTGAASAINLNSSADIVFSGLSGTIASNGGAININTGTGAANMLSMSGGGTVNMTNASQLNIKAPIVDFGASGYTLRSTAGATNILIQAPGANNLIVRGFKSTQGFFNTNGGTFAINTAAGNNNIDFTNKDGAGPDFILNLDGGNSTISTNNPGKTTINKFVTISSDSNISFSGSGTVTNKGTISQGGTFTINTDALILDPASSIIAGTVNIFDNGNGLLIGTSGTGGTDGFGSIIAKTGNVTIQSNTGALVFQSTIPGTKSPEPTNPTLINLVSQNGAVNIISNGPGGITVGPAGSGTVTMMVYDNNTTLPHVTQATNLTMTANGQTITNNGNIYASGNITMQANAGSIINNGSVQANVDGAAIQVSPGPSVLQAFVSNPLNRTVNMLSTAGALTVGGTGSQIGILGTTFNNTDQVNFNSAGALNFTSLHTVTPGNGGVVNMTAPTMNFSGGAGVTAGVQTAQFNVTSPSGLIMNMLGAGAGVLTTAGNIVISPAAGQNLAITGPGALSLNTPQILFNVNGANFANSTTLSSTGTLIVDGSTGGVTFTANGTFNGTSQIFRANGAGSVSFANNVIVNTGSNTTLSTPQINLGNSSNLLVNGSINLNPNGSATLNLNSTGGGTSLLQTNAGGAFNFAAGTHNVTFTGGGGATISLGNGTVNTGAGIAGMTIANNETLNLTNTAVFTLNDGAVVNNAGTLQTSAANLTFTTPGSMSFTGGGNIQNNGGVGGNAVNFLMNATNNLTFNGDQNLNFLALGSQQTINAGNGSAVNGLIFNGSAQLNVNAHPGNSLLINTDAISVQGGTTAGINTQNGQAVNMFTTNGMTMTGIGGGATSANTALNVFGGVLTMRGNNAGQTMTNGVSISNMTLNTNRDTTIKTNGLAYETGAINVNNGGNNRLTFTPDSTVTTINLGVLTGSTAFDFSAAELANITANQVQVGNSTSTANIVLAGNANVGGYDFYLVGNGAGGIQRTGGVITGNNVWLDTQNTGNIGSLVNPLQFAINNLGFNAGNTSSVVSLSNAGNLNIISSSAFNNVAGTSTVGQSLNIITTVGGNLTMNSSAGSLVNFTNTGAGNAIASFNVAGNIGTQANPFHMTSAANSAIKINAQAGGEMNFWVSEGLISNGNITAGTGMRFFSPTFVNNFAITSNAGTALFTNDDPTNAGNPLNPGNPVLDISGTGSINSPTMNFYNVGNAPITIVQNGLGNSGGNIIGSSTGNMNVTINGNQNSINFGDAGNRFESQNGTMTLTFAGPGTNNTFTMNLNNTLKSNGVMNITLNTGDLFIPYLGTQTKIDAGVIGAHPFANQVTMKANTGSINGNVESFIGVLNGQALGNWTALPTTNLVLLPSDYDTSHSDFSFTVYNSDFSVGGGGTNVTNAPQLYSRQGNVTLRAMNPNTPNNLNAGGAVGQGGNLTVVDNSSIRAAFNVTLVSRQQITFGNVVSYDQLADPTDPQNPANPVVTGSAAGVNIQAGDWATGYVFDTTQNQMIPMSTAANANSSPFNSLGRILIDNRNPDNPGAMLPATAGVGSGVLGTASGGFEPFDAQGNVTNTNRNIVFGDNIQLISHGGMNDLANRDNKTGFNQGSIYGGVLVRGANRFVAGTNLTMGSYGSDVVIDAANGILLSDANLGVVPPPGQTNPPTNNFFSYGYYIPELINPQSGLWQADTQNPIRVMTPSNNGQYPLNMYSGGRIGFYAGVPKGVRSNFNAGPASTIDVNGQLYAGILVRDLIPSIRATPGIGFIAANNQINGSNGNLYLIFSENAASGTTKIYNGNTLNGNGGVVILDPPAGGPFINLGGSSKIFALGAPIFTPPGFVPPPGGTIINGVLVSLTLPNFGTLGGAVVGTDSTRSVSINLSGTVTTMLDQGFNKKKGDQQDATIYTTAGACQPFYLDENDQDTIMVGEAGSQLSPGDNRSVTLKQGKVVAMVGKQSIKVDTGFGNVQISGNSAAIIQQGENGVVRVANLSGQATNITVNRNGKTEILTAEAGEELCLADEALSEEELIPVDGVDREPILGSVTVPGVKIAKSKFDQKMMMEKEKLLVCNSGSFYQMKSKINKLKDDVNKSAKPLKPSGAPTVKPLQKEKAIIQFKAPALSSMKEDESGSLKPISFMEPTGASGQVRTFSTHSALVKHSSKTVISFEHPTIMQIKSGEALISADKVTVIKTPHSMVTINPGTIALVSVADGVTKVRNVWEMNRKTIRQTVQGKFIDIAAGQETVLGNDTKAVDKAISHDMVGRRSGKGFELPGGMILRRSEVSLVSLMQLSDLLNDLVSSKNEKDKVLTSKLVKMAAVLQQVTAGHGNYGAQGQGGAQ